MLDPKPLGYLPYLSQFQIRFHTNAVSCGVSMELLTSEWGLPRLGVMLVNEKGEHVALLAFRLTPDVVAVDEKRRHVRRYVLEGIEKPEESSLIIVGLASLQGPVTKPL